VDRYGACFRSPALPVVGRFAADTDPEQRMLWQDCELQDLLPPSDTAGSTRRLTEQEQRWPF